MKRLLILGTDRCVGPSVAVELPSFEGDLKHLEAAQRELLTAISKLKRFDDEGLVAEVKLDLLEVLEHLHPVTLTMRNDLTEAQQELAAEAS